MSAARRRARRASWVPVLGVLLAACSSGGGGNGGASPSAGSRLEGADATVQAALAHYLHTVSTKCKTASSPVVCVEGADRKLGGQVHDYANVLAVGHGFSAPPNDLTAARNDAQTLANSLEILGDAQPTQANYDQVLNDFDVNAAVHKLQNAVTQVNGALG
jgi:hypothetical protein